LQEFPVTEITKHYSHQKSPPHQSGTTHATTHRLFYIDVKDPEYASFSLDLVHVSRTEYYAGLFTSSPKVTLYLVGKTVSGNGASSTSALAVPGTSTNSGGESWECEVCGCKNRIPAGHSPSSNQVCELCGVPRPSTATHSSSSSSSTQPLSKSLPSTPKSPTLTITDSVACPACTFLNHPSLRECEVCGTQLPMPASSSSSQSVVKSAPATRPASPDTDDDDDGGGDGKKMMKVSFRKGGDKPFYTVLKRSLQSRDWEVCFSLVIHYSNIRLKYMCVYVRVELRICTKQTVRETMEVETTRLLEVVSVRAYNPFNSRMMTHISFQRASFAT
jgi:ESCRT-II complex subunit VPS36